MLFEQSYGTLTDTSEKYDHLLIENDSAASMASWIHTSKEEAEPALGVGRTRTIPGIEPHLLRWPFTFVPREMIFWRFVSSPVNPRRPASYQDPLAESKIAPSRPTWSPGVRYNNEIDPLGVQLTKHRGPPESHGCSPLCIRFCPLYLLQDCR